MRHSRTKKTISRVSLSDTSYPHLLQPGQQLGVELSGAEQEEEEDETSGQTGEGEDQQ